MTQIILKTTSLDSPTKNGLNIGEMKKLSLDSNNVNHDVVIGKNTNVYSRAVRRFVKRWRRAYNGEIRSRDTISLSSSTTGTTDGASIKSSMLYGIPRLATPDTDLASESTSYDQQSDVADENTSKLSNIAPETKTTAASEAQIIIDSVMRIHGQIVTMTSFKPCPEINALFSELVGIAIRIHTREVTGLVSRNTRIFLK